MKVLGCLAALLLAVLVAGFAVFAWLLGDEEIKPLPQIDWEGW